MDITQKSLARVAFLESKIDMLESELTYLNDILVKCGFTNGITTLKSTLEDLLAEDAEAASETEEQHNIYEQLN